MDPATGVSSCDDHLDLSAVPPGLWESRLARAGADVIPRLGADSCLWASDYPHTDRTFPNSRDAIEGTLGTLPVEDRRKLTVTNCAHLYGFEVA